MPINLPQLWRKLGKNKPPYSYSRQLFAFFFFPRHYLLHLSILPTLYLLPPVLRRALLAGS
jgi:hypothetical protein